MTADLKRISKYLDNLDNQVEQWGQETTVVAADKTLGYMKNQQHELKETIWELDEKISKTKKDTTKSILMELKSRAKILQQQIEDRVKRINDHIIKLTELQIKMIQLGGEMKSIASVIKISFPNGNPKDETSGETLDEALKRKAEELREWAEYNPSDFLCPCDNATLDFEIRNSISIRHVLGSTFDNILLRFRLDPKYENADLAEPLKNKRDDVLSYLDELEGKTTPETPKPAKTFNFLSESNMLDPKIFDLTKRAIKGKIKRRQIDFQKELNREGRRLQISGNAPEKSSCGKNIFRDMFIKEIRDRAITAWNSLHKIHGALGSQLTQTLAADFREAVAHFQEEIKSELSKFMSTRPCFVNDATANSFLDAAEKDVYEEIYIEIELYVNKLRFQTSTGGNKPGPKARERQQGKKSAIEELEDPVTCQHVGNILHKRSDSIARSLKDRNYLVVKSCNKNYCQAKDAAIVWPKWKKYWQNQKNAE